MKIEEAKENLNMSKLIPLLAISILSALLTSAANAGAPPCFLHYYPNGQPYYVCAFGESPPHPLPPIQVPSPNCTANPQACGKV